MIGNSFGTALTAMAIAAASPAGATAITFDDVDPNPCCVFLDSYSASGLIFTNLEGGSEPRKLFFPPDVNPFGFTNIDPGGASILGDPLRMRVDGGGTFDLYGFTFGLRPVDAPLTGNIKVRFVYDDGHDEIESFLTDTFGPKAISATRLGLRRVEWLRGIVSYDIANCGVCNHTGSSIGSFAIDDVIVDNIASSPDPIPPVALPEPSTWALMVLGFGLVGGAARQRRQVGNLVERMALADPLSALRSA